MKVLHVYKTYLPEDFTGVPRVIHGLAEGMAVTGVKTDVLTLGSQPTDDTIPVGQHIVHVARRNLNIAATGLSWQAFGLFRRLSAQADIVHYHFPWPFADLLHFSAPPKCPTIVTYHSDIVRQKRLLGLYAPLRDRFLGDVDCLIATSSNYLESSEVLRRFRQKTEVIPIGIPDAPAPPPHLTSAWRQRVGEGFFLFVGALRYYKGLQFLMEAAKISNLPLVIAGAGDQSKWAAMAGSNVKFVGPITDDDKAALLYLSKAFVFPSHLRSEAFGISLAEAARAGRPMVSAEIGTGTTYVNVNNVTGLAVPPANAQALADAMLRLAKDERMAARMGLAARQHYEGNFRLEAMVSAHLTLYRKLLSRPITREAVRSWT